ncbi:MAG: HEAT repeat domain-containing protein, partial [Bacteroidota bacterium]
LSELVLKTLQSQVSKEKNALVRCAVDNSLGELAKAVPKHSIVICDRLTRVVSDDKAAASVRSAAVAALGEFNEDKRVEEIRTALLEAAKDSYRAVRRAAANAIGKRVRDSKELDKEYLEALLSLSQERSSSSVFCKVAIKALSNFSTRQLIEGYCSGLHNSVLVKQIWRRLCAQSLVESPGRDRNHYKLTLYQGVGEPITWQGPKAAVDRLKRALRAHNPKVTWGEYLGSEAVAKVTEFMAGDFFCVFFKLLMP